MGPTTRPLSLVSPRHSPSKPNAIGAMDCEAVGDEPGESDGGRVAMRAAAAILLRARQKEPLAERQTATNYENAP